MPEFLSDAWIEDLDRALATLAPASPDDAAGPDLVIEQRVTRPDGTIHRHHLVVADGRFRAVRGPAAAPDLVLTTDLDTAVAIQRGAVNAQLAMAAGHLRLGGNLDRLMSAAAVFHRLDDVFATLRTSTSLPTDGPTERPAEGPADGPGPSGGIPEGHR